MYRRRFFVFRGCIGMSAGFESLSHRQHYVILRSARNDG